MIRIIRSASALALLFAALPGAGAAQADPADALSTHLRALVANPRDLTALLGAGQAALDVGDPNAAYGFFGRALDINPRSGAAKAGLGSALVMLERPDEALKQFGEAVSLGVPEGSIAKDRGLAYDLRGDNRRAQQDYALALTRGSDDEVTRRYALSLGISGDRAAAMTMLDPLLRRKDQGAWRARAFVMAMTGDVAGGDAIARAVMPPSLAGTMTPFLARLATLNSADRAHAVNFGTMPANGQSYAAVRAGDPYRAAAAPPQLADASSALIPAGEPLGTRPAPEPLSRAPRRVPGREASGGPASVPVTQPSAVAPAPGFSEHPSTARVGERVGQRIGPVDPARLPPEARGAGPAVAAGVVTRGALPPPSPGAAAPAPMTASVSPSPSTNGPVERPAFEISPPTRAATLPSVPPPAVGSAPTSALAAAAPVGSRLAAILAGIVPEEESRPVALPTADQIRAVQRAQRKKAAEAAAAAAAEKAASDAKAAALAATRANPARLWVQIATGANAAGLPGTWRRLRDANEAALKAHSPWTTPFRATNRLLVGPMKSAADARALVNALAKSGVQATTFSSDAGQEVTRVAAK